MDAKIPMSLACSIFFLYCVSVPAMATEERTLIRVFPQDFFEFDPGKAISVRQYELLSDIGEGLVRVDKMGKPEPGLAKSWKIDTPKKTVTFHLKDHIYWSNGDPIIANDFISSWQRSFQNYPNYSFRSTFENIEYDKERDRLKIYAPNNKTIIVHFKKLDLFFPGKTLFPPLHAIPSVFIQNNPSNWSKNPNLPYNGAYIIEQINYEEEALKDIQLTINQHHYDSNQIKIKKVNYIYKNTKRSYHRKIKSYQDSLIDIFTSQKRENKTLREKNLIKRFGYKEVIDKTLLLSMLLINKNRVNEKLEQAIKLLTDPRFIIKRSKHKVGKPIYRILYTVKNEKSLNNKFNIDYDKRLEKAKALLESLNISKEKPIKLNLYALGSIGENITKIIAGKLNSHGIKVNYKLTSLHEYSGMNNKNEKVDLALALWHLDTQAITSILDVFSYSDLEILTNQDKEAIALMAIQASKNESKKRQEVYNKMESLILNNGGVKPLLGQDISSIIKNDICGWSSSETLLHPSMWLYYCPNEQD